MKQMSSVKARDSFAEVVNQAAYGDEPVVITRRGKPVCAIISIGLLNQLQGVSDEQCSID